MEVTINYFAVLVAGAASVVLGGLWYGPLFGKQWMRLAGISMEGMKSMKMTPMGAMIGGFLTGLVMAYVLAHLLVFSSAYTLMSGIPAGLSAGFWCWLGFLVPATAAPYLYEGKSIKLWFLHAAYYLVSLLIMGTILGAWA